ncbi:MAG: hypothetical protein IMZ50_12920 [Candidatus Atribacteria bacterium]|nr:hypothetical protein [Candidatus Atribacteria bacterium]
MLKSHMDAKEDVLVAISKIPANSGHSLHKGTPREAFIREFLESHLPENVAIGTGEIIDANSQPGEQRNQFDIVIYKKNYPKLDFGGGISGFLIESVIATVEVKSTLTQADLEQAIKAARNAKSLTPNVTSSFHSGYIPPKVLNYVVAYDGPGQMQTVYNWIPQIHATLGITTPDLPQDEAERLSISSPSIDGVFVLKKGFIYFDNVPTGFANSQARVANPNLKWVFTDTTSGNILLLFIMLQSATANIEGKWLNPIPYLASFQVPNVQFGTA